MAKRKNKKTNASKTIKQNKKKTLKQSFASDVKRLNKTSYSQNFASYNDIYGSEDLDYDLIDGLYESTILNRVLRKIASDAVPEMFTIQVVDMEGKRIPEIEQECFRYTAALKRKHIKEIYLTQMKYGTAFLYIGNKEDDRLVNLFSIHPKDIKPQINESDE